MCEETQLKIPSIWEPILNYNHVGVIELWEWHFTWLFYHFYIMILSIQYGWQFIPDMKSFLEFLGSSLSLKITWVCLMVESLSAIGQFCAISILHHTFRYGLWNTPSRLSGVMFMVSFVWLQSYDNDSIVKVQCLVGLSGKVWFIHCRFSLEEKLKFEREKGKTVSFSIQ